MATAATQSGVNPELTVAGLSYLKAVNAILQNFSAHELVIETGRDIFVRVEQKLVLTVFAKSSI